MKINKKVLIPLFATAMGLSVIGGVSGAVAWYQYNTKVQASFMGVTTADGGVLQIKKSTDTAWNSYADFGDAQIENLGDLQSIGVNLYTCLMKKLRALRSVDMMRRLD